MLFKPGSKWAYSNLGFELLGYLIERVSGQSFEQYMAQKIFVPLHMASTTFFYKEVPDTLLAWPHVKDKSGEITPSLFYPYNRSRISSSDLNTSMTEMKNFSEFVFNRGKFQGKEILSEKSFDLMWTKQIETNKRSFPDEHRYNGLGWFMGERHKFKVIGHIGGDTGSRSSMTYIPEKEIMIFLAGNSDEFKFWELTLNIIDRLVEK
jgi:CubicO group peptidase (beta-lactamase class C family)